MIKLFNLALLVERKSTAASWRPAISGNVQKNLEMYKKIRLVYKLPYNYDYKLELFLF